MSKKILILGRSGSGKSTSLRNFKKGEVGIISCVGKEMPFKTDIPIYEPKFTPETMNRYPNTLRAIREAKAKVLVIDDANYLMSTEFMATAGEKGYDKWADLAQCIWGLLDYCHTLRDDLTVIMIFHSQTQKEDDGYTFTRIKTSGRKLDKLCIESKLTTVLYATVKDGRYIFMTRMDNSTAKTPLGAFEENEIDNDIVPVLKALEEY